MDVRTQMMQPGDPDWPTAVGLFDDYRRHYGEQPALEQATWWMTGQAGAGQLLVTGAWLADRLVGLATCHRTPASLRMAHFWQLRDVYVHADARRQGVARALVASVLSSAAADGALRVSLQTEPENSAALQLYRSLDFETVDGLLQLSRRPR